MTTTQDINTCPECGESYGHPIPTRSYAMISHMMNKGELTLGEARAELTSGFPTAEVAALLAGWIMDRSDQDDSWRAGDPVRLADGRVVAYADENMARRFPARLVRTGDETWGFDPDTDADLIHPAD